MRQHQHSQRNSGHCKLHSTPLCTPSNWRTGPQNGGHALHHPSWQSPPGQLYALLGTSSIQLSPAKNDTNPAQWVPAILYSTNVSVLHITADTADPISPILLQTAFLHWQGTANIDYAVILPVSITMKHQHCMQWSHKDVLLHSFCHWTAILVHHSMNSFPCCHVKLLCRLLTSSRGLTPELLCKLALRDGVQRQVLISPLTRSSLRKFSVTGITSRRTTGSIRLKLTPASLYSKREYWSIAITLLRREQFSETKRSNILNSLHRSAPL